LTVAVFAISDLHMPAREKPMDIFGAHWDNHIEKISADWRARVRSEDIVLLPGDLTWAMRLSDAMEDIEHIGALPGRKIILRGNHDYWWGAIGRVREMLPAGMYAIQNDALLLDGMLFAGSRGWLLPGADAKPEDVKIYERERLRLGLSLRAARQISENAPLIALMHYPPFSAAHPGYADILEQYRADVVVYGHLHGASLAYAFSGVRAGISYHQVSCDGLDFRLKQIPI
jgi:predicted phosphohydrolase